MHIWTCLLAAASAGLTSAVDAADISQSKQDTSSLSEPWGWLNNVYLHLGPAGVLLDARAKIYTPVGRYPGATIRVAPQVTATTEVGYWATPNWAVSITGGVPPTSSIDGAGSIKSAGKLGSNTAGLVSVTGHYHVTSFGAFQPYIGGGPAYLISFNSHDGSTQDLQVRSAWAAVGQIGFDYMLTSRLGVFVDYKKAFLRTTSFGSLNGISIRNNVKLDPNIVSGGMTFRF